MECGRGVGRNSCRLHGVTKSAKMIWNWCVVEVCMIQMAGQPLWYYEIRWEWVETRCSPRWRHVQGFLWGSQNVTLTRTFRICHNPVVARWDICFWMNENTSQPPKFRLSEFKNWLLYWSPLWGLDWTLHSLCGCLQMAVSLVGLHQIYDIQILVMVPS
jgi:hypothetical protein